MTEQEERERLRYLQLKKKKAAAVGKEINGPTKKGLIRTSAEKIVDSPALPIAGGIVGGIAGLPSGPGAIGAAALGGAAGEAYRQLAKRSLGMDAPQTSLEAAKEIGISGLEQGAGEAVGLGMGRGARAVAKLKPVKAALGMAKKTAGDLFQIVTKIKPQDAETLFKNPKAILPSQWTRAQEAWKQAAKEAGLPVDEVSPEIINALKKDARGTVFSTFEKLAGNEPVSAADAQVAKQALDIALMPAAKTERNKPLVVLYGKMRKQFVKRIGEESPELAKANKEYGVARAGKRFRSLFPRNLDDSPAYFRSSVLPGLLTSAGAFRGDPIEGALQGAGVAALSSPLAIGSLIAMAGGARTLVPYARRTATATLANLIGDRFRRE